MSDTILLVGAGPMAVEYAKVLQALDKELIVIGRSEASAGQFVQQTGIPVVTGGLDRWLAGRPQLPTKAIVCVGENLLGEVTRQLMQAGVRNILVEKPAGLDGEDIRQVAAKAQKTASTVYVGYNRRFYASTRKAREIILEDGGVSSFHFEFTEWAHVIEKLEKAPGVKEAWFLANSSHVIDLAFFLGGQPQECSSFTAGGLSWHPSASIFTGAGVSLTGALFSYNANWEAPGRWSLEVMTKKHRLIFKPMEKLQVQKHGSVAIEEVSIDDELDKIYKPGLFLQVEAFCRDSNEILPDISEHLANLAFYEKIGRKS